MPAKTKDAEKVALEAHEPTDDLLRYQLEKQGKDTSGSRAQLLKRLNEGNTPPIDRTK